MFEIQKFKKPFAARSVPNTLDLLVDETLRLLLPPEETTSSTLSIPRPSTDRELLDLTEYYLGVRIPNKACCSGHSAPAKAFCDAYFARTPFSIWKAARGLGGKSFMLAALAWMESVTLRASVTILGGSGHQSANVHEYLRSFWLRQTAPAEALKDDTTAANARLIWGNTVRALTASQTSVRGPHPHRVRMDEVDEMEWGICSAARGQAMSRDDIPANTVFSSTHQNADGTLTKLLIEAAEKGMPVYEWCYKETMAPHGWLTEAAMQRFRTQLTTETWRVEVELGEPSPEGRAIVPECVEKMFSLGNEKIGVKAGEEFRDPEGQYFEFEEPLTGAQYATGADWGSKGDETVIWTWRCDCYPMRLVAYEHLTRRPMPWMIERLMARLRRFPGDAFHDATGVGTYHADLFTEPVDDYVMVGKKRNDLFTNYITDIENGACAAPRLLSAYHAHKYVRNKDLYGAEAARESGEAKGHPPDPLVAAAMAYAAALSARHPLALSNSGGTPAHAQQYAQQSGGAAPLRSLTNFMRRKE